MSADPDPLAAAPAPMRGPRCRADTAAVLFALLYPALMTWLYFVAMAGQSTAVQQGVYCAGKLIQFSFPLVWVLAMQRKGLRWQRVGLRGVPLGLLFGAGVLAAMLFGYHGWLKHTDYLAEAAAKIHAKVSAFQIDTPAKFALLGLGYSLAHSLLEEYYWRWFVFAQLHRLVRLWPAVVISSIAFSAHHVIVLGEYLGWNSPAAWGFSLAVGVGGGVWAWLYQRSGSLLGVWLSHALVDAAIFWIGYELIAESIH